MMKNNCATEFDLKVIYNKLTNNRHTPTVKACDFFSQPTELELLQNKLNAIMPLRRSVANTGRR